MGARNSDALCVQKIKENKKNIFAKVPNARMKGERGVCDYG